MGRRRRERKKRTLTRGVAAIEADEEVDEVAKDERAEHRIGEKQRLP